MNDEVSVAELLVREGWGDRPVQSRWRVVAVMLAVVIGCGAAAVLVAFSSGQVRQDAAPVDEIQVVPMPQRTTGLGGAGQATDSPNDGGVGGGTGGDVVPGTHEGTVTEVPGRPSDTESSTESATATTAPTAGAPGSTTAPTTTTTPVSGQQQPPPPPTTSTSPPHQVTCILIICW
ncbi:hypothetical protein [Amycolatopsis sp. WQ 127309]|uniref:hypothetical protein n=1 Tax=Amycolatopsis sp. WQ 127309 TaxID=2932773 RepID=UPI001FF4C624|nr:hypothetical protein [Amycolatopsis sp. WQ 127309]UOZ09391.1 hypothetical protein MUY22_14410 [Amycolatopsis sp. WQ 127309]